ncbi:hypothetical protein L6452_21924 [Arctium lappa]|uniref:Uncharacterized protein n=1 Tax=Arctium lappa TaxID=4217 RepID=A0ACB9AZ19_ARCLA|nr:hypothetical protein L6452_21924 [Arctium lappa]
MNPEERSSMMYCPLTVPDMKTTGRTVPVPGYDAWRFEDDVVDDARDNHEVHKKGKGKDDHRGREGYVSGRLPIYKEVILLNNLIDCARPGEEIVKNGVSEGQFNEVLMNKMDRYACHCCYVYCCPEETSYTVLSCEAKGNLLEGSPID